MSFHIRIYRTQKVNPQQKEEIIFLCNRAFEGRESFYRLFEFVQEGVHALGFLDNCLISHAVLTPRCMQINTGPFLRCAYVDAVATDPDQRRKGYGAAVMRRLASEMAIRGYQIGGLSTSTPEFYESTGWRRWSGPLAGRDGDEIIPTQETDAVMVLRLPATPVFDVSNDQLSIEKQNGRIW